MTKRDGWSEEDLASLSDEEHDHFERKSGRLFESGRDEFLNTLAKAISAFSNSGGGTIVIGEADDGKFDGIVPRIGREGIRDWIEKQIPVLTDYPLADFRVHTVKRASVSHLPIGREIVVVEVGDSAAAPHQSKRDKIYYRREGGRSVPAPHFYLELLRQRLTNPVLDLSLTGIHLKNAFEPAVGDGLFLVCDLRFVVTNVGRVSANHWQINIRSLEWDDSSPIRHKDILFSDFPTPKTPTEVPSSINVGSRVILPGCTFSETRQVGFLLRPVSNTQSACIADLDYQLSSLKIGFQIATETSPGSVNPISLRSAYNSSELIDAAFKRCPAFFTVHPLDR